MAYKAETNFKGSNPLPRTIEEPRDMVWGNRRTKNTEKLFKIIDTNDSNIAIKHSIHILFMFYMFDFVQIKFWAHIHIQFN